jgi:hypothetical protein
MRPTLAVAVAGLLRGALSCVRIVRRAYVLAGATAVAEAL